MPKYNQHLHNEILIPQHISNYCLFSAQFILLNSLVSFNYNLKLLAALQLCLYISTLFFWKQVSHNGIEKKIDIFFVITTCSYGTYISFSLPKFYNLFWLCSVSLSMIIFITNETLFYYQVRIFYNKQIKNINSKIVKYNFFSLKYTNPNTHEREMAYYRNTIVHGTCFHIFIPLSAIYCICHGLLKK